jgi:hypothetical protein
MERRLDENAGRRLGKEVAKSRADRSALVGRHAVVLVDGKARPIAQGVQGRVKAIIPFARRHFLLFALPTHIQPIRLSDPVVMSPNTGAGNCRGVLTSARKRSIFRDAAREDHHPQLILQ